MPNSTGVVMADLDGLQVTAEENEFLLHPDLGGIILFSRNFESRQQVSDLVAEVREIRKDIMIAVDQEGGRVQRFRDGFTRLPPMQCFAAFYEKEKELALRLAESCGWVMASEVRSTGVDFSFAPVLDVDKNLSSIIGDRAFSDQPEVAMVLAEAFIKGMHAAGMPATGKHFPGHGAVVADSHLETPIDRRSLSEIMTRDVTPFAQLIERQQLDGIMPAHVVYEQLDKNPAVFSEYWLKTLLREELGFNGVIFSDDLCMEGAVIMGDFTQRTEIALQAGCDMVLVCNNRQASRDVLSAAESLPKSQQNFSCFRTSAPRLSFDEIQSHDAYACCLEQALFS